MERGGSTYTYHRDALGSITEVTDTSGALVERYEYDVYGVTTIFDNTNTQLAESAIGNPYLFTGRRYDPESGNYYYRARIYSLTLGRFLQMDPLGYVDGLNLYAYVGNNPASWVDPHGLWFGFDDVITGPVDELLVLGYVFCRVTGVIGLLDALLSEIVGDDEEDPSPSSTSEDEHEICSNNVDPGNKRGPDVTDKIYDKIEELSEATDSKKKIPWGSWQDYPKVTMNGQEYAKVGDRLYSRHAVDRMQPSGMRYSGRGPGSTGGMPQIRQTGGNYDYGRSVAPQYVEDVIASTPGVEQPNGNLSHMSGSLEIILNPQGAVVTIITH